MNITAPRFLRTALCAAALTGASLSFAQLTLTNSPAWNGIASASYFGEGAGITPNYGQTFTVDPINSVMNSFTFHMFNALYDEDVKFSVHVAAWGGSKLTGPLLFSSTMQTLPASTLLFQAFTINTGSLSLIAGAQYVAFLSVFGHEDSVPDASAVGVTAPSSYSGGHFVFTNHVDIQNLGDLALVNWTVWDSDDLAFTMEFSREGGGNAVPEPSTYGLIGAMALLGLVVVRRARRN